MAQDPAREAQEPILPADLADLLETPRQARSGRVMTGDGSVRIYVTLRTEADLRKLIALLPRARGTIVGQVFGEIVLRERVIDDLGRDRVRGLYVPQCDVDLVLLGMTDDAGITFNMTFDGDWRGWDEGTRRGENGLQFRGRRLVLKDLAFRTYNWLGGAVRSDASESTWIHGCTFANIGSITFPTSMPASEVRSATDTLYTGSAVSGTTPALHLYDCTFEDVGRGNAWNHSIYPSTAGAVRVVRCHFHRCGNPLALGYRDRIVVRECTFDNEGEPTVEFRRGRKYMQGYLIYFNPKAEIEFTGNVIRGVYDDVIHQGEGAMDPRRHHFARNDYRGVRQTEGHGFWFVMGEGTRPWRAWKESGFDEGATPPPGRALHQPEDAPGTRRRPER